MVNSEQKGQEEKKVVLDHAHVPTLVNTRIGEVSYGIILRIEAKLQCGLPSYYTQFSITYMHSCVPALLRLGCLLPKFVTTLAPYLSRSPRRGIFHKLDQPWPEHWGNCKLFLRSQTLFPATGQKLVLSRRWQRIRLDAFIRFWPANMRPCLLHSTQARLNMLLQGPSGLIISPLNR
jgi:hypothetical protein